MALDMNKECNKQQSGISVVAFALGRRTISEICLDDTTWPELPAQKEPEMFLLWEGIGPPSAPPSYDA